MMRCLNDVLMRRIHDVSFLLHFGDGFHFCLTLGIVALGERHVRDRGQAGGA